MPGSDWIPVEPCIRMWQAGVCREGDGVSGTRS